MKIWGRTAVLIGAVVIAGGLIIWFGLSDRSIDNVPDQNDQTETVKLSSAPSGQNYLVDSRGMALYYFAKDTVNKSNCAAGPCLDAWPIFYVENVVVSSPLDKEDFGLITRDDGLRQTTYKGWPAYYYFQDVKPGDILGEGVGNVWYIFAEPFYNVMVLNKAPFNNYLVNSRGMTLYYFTNDTRGTATTTVQSACTGQCLATWPVFDTDDIIAPSLLQKADFSILTRADGTRQAVYKGWPLYYFANDRVSGDTNGDNVNGVWFVVKP